MNVLLTGVCFLCSSAALLEAAEIPVFSLSFSELPSFLQWNIRKQVSRQGDLIESWTGWNSALKNSEGPHGGLVFMQEIDLVGDERKERIFLYQSPEVARTLPRQDEHVRVICNADGTCLYTIPSFCLRGKKIGNVFRGEEAYYFCPDRHVNRFRFTYGWKQWELTEQYGRVLEWSGCEETDPKDGTHWKSGVEQTESVYVTTGVIKETCSLSPGRRRVPLSQIAEGEDPLETIVKEKAKSPASPEQEKLKENKPSETVWVVSLFELLTQDIPHWKCFREVSLKEAEKEWRKVSGPAIEQSRQWNQKEAVRAMDALLHVKNLREVKACPLFPSPAETVFERSSMKPEGAVDREEP